MTSQQYDLVIRGGTIVNADETIAGDVAVTDGRVVRVGVVDGSGTEEVDATDCIVVRSWQR